MTSYTFSQLIDFTRTTSGTYTNSSGFITSTPASVNLLTYTQEFDNAAWTKTNTTVTANNVAAPDGTLTADTLTASAGAAVHNVGQNTTISGVACTWSIYAKAGTSSFLQLVHTANSNFFANFNLATGAVGTVGSLATATITSVGNGWYRCSMTFTPTSGSLMRAAMISSATAVFNESWTAAGTETVFIWGAQLELGSTASTYTRNYGGLYPPRFDYNPVTLAPKGLLIEEQRTNLFTYSEQFDNAAWTKTTTTATADATTSPDGTVDADSIVPNSGAALGSSVTFQQITKAASAIAYTYSVFVKANGFNRVLLRCQDSGGAVNCANVTVNVTTGAIVTAAATAGTFTSASAAVTSFGNGWYRVALSFTSSTDTALRSLVFVLDSVATTGDGTSGIFLYGAQLEAGAFATSYIPTVASQVTRTADVAAIQAPNFASWYNQSEGTFYVQGIPTTTASSGALSIDDGTSSQRMQVRALSNSAQATVVDGGATQANITTGTWAANATGQCAFAYEVDNFACAAGGDAAGTDAAGTVPTVNNLKIGGSAGLNQAYFNGHIRSIRYYPTRLTDAQLQALTA